MSKLTCGFIGLGLIGGSIAKALKASAGPVRILACDTSRSTLDAAVSDGIVDLALTAVDASFRECDYIFLCAPVSCNNNNLEPLKQHISPSCILTDVGSVKAGIHQAIENAGLTARFIGGHPMAGSERTGYQNSRALLLENAYYILTPSPEVSPDKVYAFRNLIRLMGAIPLELTYEEHDYVTAAVSHLPHIIAASLVNLVRESDSPDGIMKMIAAGGFKDITRIASSSSSMWQQICLTNTGNILMLLDAYMASLEQFRAALAEHWADGLYDFFDSARIYRESFINASSGPIKRSYALTVEIADEPGALASIATMLALHAISIKNIGIVHNREYEEGTLRIEFYEESAAGSAEELLSAKGYPVHSTKE